MQACLWQTGIWAFKSHLEGKDTTFDFSDADFWDAITDLSKTFAEDEQLRRMNGNRGSKHFIYINRTFFGLYHLLHDLGAKIQTEEYKKYL